MRIVSDLMRKGFLMSPSLVREEIDEKVLDKLSDMDEKPLVIDRTVYEALRNSNDVYAHINWKEFDKSKVLYEKNKGGKDYNVFLDILNYNTDDKNKYKVDKILKQVSRPEGLRLEEDVIEPNLIVVKEYKENIKKRDVQDFVQHFRARYNVLKNILINRPELKDCISINRVLNKNESEKVSIIGLIIDKRTSKNGNIILDVEDMTGKITGIIGKNKKELFDLSLDLVFDQVIGLTGTCSDKIIFVNDIFLPDIPVNNHLKKINEDYYVVFTSDLHVGSKMFIEKDFIKFLEWLNGNYGTEEQKEIASKVKFLFLVGDLIEGVGIYPGQEEDLLIKDIKKQYDKFSDYLINLRKDIKIIIIGGNHDSLRLAEPQPKLHPIYAKSLYELNNTTILTNPSTVNIFSSRDFEGFNVLMYHGSSFPYLADTVESVRLNGRLDRADLIMKHSLQARHLAPTHNSVQYIPENGEDPLVIDKVPDFYVSGHIHKVTALNYKGVTMIGAGCWTEQTEDQEKRGIVPDPSKVVVVSLKTREVKIFNFGENE
jgi:DNA polymerase II small subunit